MDPLAQKLDTKLRTWKPETAAQVRERVAEVTELADDDVLDVMRSRTHEQETLDVLDEPTRRQLGTARGDFVVPEDFDAPLPEDVMREFER